MPKKPKPKAQPRDKQSPDSIQPSASTKTKIVSFNFPGSKVTLAPHILAHAPVVEGNKIIELCAGRGNLTWQAWGRGFKFSQWVVNDTRMIPFFKAIRNVGDTVKVPPHSDAEKRKQQTLAATGDQKARARALALESWLCHNGGLYDSTRCRTGGGRRTPEAEEANMRLAHRVIHEMKPRLIRLDWLTCLEKEKPGPRDLVMIDWPYMGHDMGAYSCEEILPVELIQYLSDHTRTSTNTENWTNWFLCEGDQPLYLENFGPPVFRKVVKNRQFGTSRVECLWTSESVAKYLASGANHDMSRFAKPVPADRKDTYYIHLGLKELLTEIRESIAVTTRSRLQMNAELRKRLLPALLALRKLTYRKKPGFYETLRSIGLNGDTVRQWFYRSRAADEVIDLVEEPPSKVAGVRRARKTRNEGRGGDEEADAVDLNQRFLLQADKIVAALLRDKITQAKRLAREYAESRKLVMGSDAHRELNKAA